MDPLQNQNENPTPTTATSPTQSQPVAPIVPQPDLTIGNQPHFNTGITPPRNKPSRKTILIGIGVLILLVSVPAIWFVTSGRDENNLASTTNQETPSQQEDGAKSSTNENTNSQDGTGSSDSPTSNQPSSGSDDSTDQDSESESSSNNTNQPASNTCGVSDMPANVCTAIKSIESEGIRGNQYVKKDTSLFPEGIKVNVAEKTWFGTSDKDGVVFYDATHQGQNYSGQLYFEKQNNNWFVVDYSVSAT